MGVTQIRGISTTCGWEHRRTRRPIIESVDRRRRATAYSTVSERTRAPCVSLDDPPILVTMRRSPYGVTADGTTYRLISVSEHTTTP